MNDANKASLQRVRALYRQAIGLRQDTDPLLSGQFEAVIGRLSALLSAMGDPIPADALPDFEKHDLTEAALELLPSTRLDGRVAIVTGGSGGLGRMAACALAQAGADVVVVARSREKCDATAAKVRALGCRALSLSVDVTEADQVEAMVTAVEKEFGRIDILFNNAGITSPRTLDDSSHDEWWKIIDVNVRGTMNCTKAVVRHMKARRDGRIINMGSILSGRGMANRSAYSASKSAILQFTKSMAFELGPFGITVNALGPTVIVTDLNRELVKTQPALYESIVKRTPLGRLGQPWDVAGPLVFLASDAAGFVNGQILYVDGGYTAG